MSEIHIRKELDIIKTTGLLEHIGSSAGPKRKANLFNWNVLIKGPNKSCYENELFKLSIIFPKDYPESPPDVKFVTKIFHPNVSLDDGTICVSSISSDWNKESNIIKVIYSIYDLLKKPNLDHGLNKEALLLYRKDYEEFKKKNKEFIEKNSLLK